MKLKSKGDFKQTKKYLNKLLDGPSYAILSRYGDLGTKALSDATPKDSGKTAQSWSYVITRDAGRTTITWKNSNVVDKVNIAIILQYGHGTNHGGYVQGFDYINPALQSIFQNLADEAWKELTDK